MSRKIEFSVAGGLIAYVAFLSEDDDEIRAFYKDYGRAAAEVRFRATIWNFEQIRPVVDGVMKRKVVADCIAPFMPDLKKATLVDAQVVTSPIIRGYCTAVNWLVGFPWPIKVLASNAEAEAWIIQSLEAKGIAVPPEAMRFTSGRS